MKRIISSSDAKHKPNPSKEEMLRTYIDDLREFDDEDVGSFITNGERTGHFWFEDGTYRLVVEGDEFGDEYWNTDERYWGDEELIEYNDIELSADELYSELLKYVPNFDRNFYGKRAIFDAYPEFYR